MGVPEPPAGRTPDMVAESGVFAEREPMLALGSEYGCAAPQLQRINDEWEKQLRNMIERAAELEGEGGDAGPAKQ